MPINKVLIIDDEELILLTTRLLLQKQGIEVRSTSDALKGQSLAAAEQPDLILLDLMMPGINGWDVLRQLKDNSTTKSIPVVLFTAGDVSVTQDDLTTREVFAMIKKPFSLKEIITLIDSINRETGDA